MRIAARVVPALLTALVLSACGGSSSTAAPAHPSTASNTALVAWFSDFCTAGDTLLQMPTPIPDPGPTTEVDRPRLRTFLSSAEAALTAAKQAFAAMRNAPTPAGNDMLAKYRQSIDGALADDAKLTSNASMFPAGELESVFVLAGIEIGLFDPAGYPDAGYALGNYLKAHPDLAAAYYRAPGCGSSDAGTTPTS